MSKFVKKKMKQIVFVVCFLALITWTNAGYVTYRAFWSSENSGASSCSGQPDSIQVSNYVLIDVVDCTFASLTACTSSPSTSSFYKDHCMNVPSTFDINGPDHIPPIEGEFIETRRYSSASFPAGCSIPPSLQSPTTAIAWFKSGVCTPQYQYSGEATRITLNSTSADVRLYCNNGGGYGDCENNCDNSGTIDTIVDPQASVFCVSVTSSSVVTLRKIQGGFGSSSPVAQFVMKYNNTNCDGEPYLIAPHPSNPILKQSTLPQNRNWTISTTCLDSSRAAQFRIPNLDVAYQSYFPFPFQSSYLEVRDAGIKQGCPVTIPFAHRLEKFVRVDYCGSDFGVISANPQSGVVFGDQCSGTETSCGGCFYTYRTGSSTNGMVCSNDEYGFKKIFALWNNGQKTPFSIP